MTIETKELVISEELKRKVEMICRFAYVDYTITNGNIKSIKNTNIAMVKPHIVKIKGIDYLIFDDCDDIFIMKIKEKKSIANFIETSFQQNLPRLFYFFNTNALTVER